MSDEVTNLAPGWAVETAAIWAQFPERKGVLDLTNRLMPELPEELFRMRKLTSLTVDNCRLANFKGAWEGIVELKVVKAEKNNVKEFDELLVHCGDTLETVSFAGNAIAKISKKISSAMFLTSLNLSNNTISEIPKEVVALGQLTELYLAGNKIKALPANFHEMRKLEKLDLRDNLIEELPLKLGICSTITEIFISGNPLSKQPELHGKDGRAEVFNFLRDRLRSKPETHVLLFDEKDSLNNVRFEINEELSPKHPILTAATLEKLIKFLTPAIPPDQPTFKAFLACYSYFAEPRDIINLMYLRFKTNSENMSSFGEDTQQTMKLVQLRVFAGLMKFLAKFNQDGLKFNDETIDLLKDFAKALGKAGHTAGATQLESTIESNKESRGRSTSKFDGEVAKSTIEDKKKKKRPADKVKDMKKKRGSGLFDSLRRAKAKKEYEEAKQELSVPDGLPPPVVGEGTPPPSKGPSSGPSLAIPTLKMVPKLDLQAVNPKQIAEQLALRSSFLLAEIDVNEFLHQAWAKPGAEFAAPCILNFIDFFNRISQWMSTEVLVEKEMSSRVAKLSHILDIAQASLDLGDFSSTYSIASAIMSAPISRLKQTWQCIDEKRIQISGALNKLSDNSGNYRSYRSLLQQKASTRVIPYLGLMLSDLTFTEEGNPNFVNDSDLINFTKFRIIHKVLDEVATYQSHSYRDIAENTELMAQIEAAERFEDEDAMYNESLRCEASRRATITAAPSMCSPQSGGGRSERRSSVPASDPALPVRRDGTTTMISSSMSMLEISSHSSQSSPRPAATTPRE
eukprot:TRINITY_DN11447_c0_g1_i1.p1 TRINITY_DN11447_c0_g1~~TRINITY_DN11447_c0_g1_i1.p1  ORF type:complete len:798 (-),score=293.74 TRINITY_DN11447_c0_g1_i1:3-2396(-)